MGRIEDWPDGSLVSAEKHYADYAKWLASHGQSYALLHERILERAKQGRTITYGELMTEFTKVPSGGYRGIGTAVGLISEFEKAHGRPYLSAIVVGKDSETQTCPLGHPSGGFFGLNETPTPLLRDLARYHDDLTGEGQRYIAEVQSEVWTWWNPRKESG